MADAKTWFMAIRPKTLTAAFVPVGVGTALAYAHGQMRPLAAIAALLVALFMQIGTNLANDYFDHQSGADNDDRLGPTRVTQAGLIPPQQVLTGAIVAFGLAFVSGLILVSMTGWPLLAVGIVSILCGFAYTGGPFPLGYNGLGDLFVFVFFGLVAVVGTYYTHTLALHPMAFWLATHVGVTAVALLVVNNLRDIETDRAVGKNTLAVLLGRTFTRAQYVAMLVIAYLVPVLAVAAGYGHPVWLLALLTLPMAIILVRRVYTLQGRELNG
ncbi:MAG: 1,4-dihydroxy-2-naphthoate polyprenyltransferase, partial [Myxococcota bacterium]